ncbi:tobamovirus multiplication protein 1-like isoform x1 [Anaeramoeba flamelloides]|uniref:Tobamovirus multiplication protein 1-like isoform x1 n=1 Tax=Anaeramoeba flamelloides TaxID=1746091 RepID=A0AAV7ZJH9_9EUKA|nr:tobamovirus multiplication protein 1-like isoform x1 [Anaeramoeba flamelloides]KAJ6226958.1 tobamovirus multiplication protein 1-like isoform x1 [Anaeramoeba flamelloides]
MRWEILVGVIICCLLLLWAITQYVFIIKRAEPGSFTSLQSLYHLITILFLIFRLIWLILQKNQDENNEFLFTINRFAICSFFTSFTLLVFFWAEIFHGLVKSTGKVKLSTLKLPFYILNGLLYIYTIVCIILYSAKMKKQENTNIFYVTNILIIAGISALTSIAFFVYGMLIMNRYKNSIFLAQKTKHLLKISVISIIYFICFILRFCMFIYNPITKKMFQRVIYIFFFYYLPEFPPIIVQLWTMKLKPKIQFKGTKLLSDIQSDDATSDLSSQSY